MNLFHRVAALSENTIICMSMFFVVSPSMGNLATRILKSLYAFLAKVRLCVPALLFFYFICHIYINLKSATALIR